MSLLLSTEALFPGLRSILNTRVSGSSFLTSNLNFQGNAETFGPFAASQPRADLGISSPEKALNRLEHDRRRLHRHLLNGSLIELKCGWRRRKQPNLVDASRRWTRSELLEGMLEGGEAERRAR